MVALITPLIVAVALPLMFRRRLFSTRAWAVALAAAIVATGPFAVSRADTRGLHRNALGALIATSVPRVAPAAGAADWRASPFGQARGEDLGFLRGSMKGRNVDPRRPGVHGGPSSRRLRQVTGSDAESHRARRPVDRLRARVRGLSREHQGSVRDALFEIPGLRYAARGSRRCALRAASLDACGRRLPDGALSLGPVRLPRHARDHRASRVRSAGRRGRDRRTGEFEFRGRRRVNRSAGAPVDWVPRKRRALLPDVPAGLGPQPVRGEPARTVQRHR